MASRLKKRTLRWLMPVHRYLGLFLSLIMLLWFLSGMVMMFHGYPRTTDDERLANLSPLLPAELHVTPTEAARTLGISDPQRIRINRTSERPKIHLLTREGLWRSVYGDTGEPVTALDRQSVTAHARTLTGMGIVSVKRLQGADQWTVSGRFNPHRPLWRVTMDDPEHTDLYFAEASGEQVHETTRSQRLWGYAGPVTHWIYPTQLRKLSGFWRQLVMWLAGFGTLACLSGLILGVMMFKRRRRKGFSPYKGLLLWHHYLGLAFGVLAMTWVFSGLLSLNPFHWSSGNRSHVPLEAALGGPHADRPEQWPAAREVAALNTSNSSLRELETWQFAGTPYYLALNEDGKRRLIPLDQTDAGSALSRGELLAAVRSMPQLQLTGFYLQTDYDNHYYPGRAGRVHGASPLLPVYRAEYAGGIHLYIAPTTGEVIHQSTPHNRANRWLYNGLHSLDFPALKPGSTGWYVLVLLLMMGGTLLSASSIWLTGRYVKVRTKS